MAQAIIGSVQTTDPWGAYDVNPVERDPSVYPRQIDESTRRSTVVNYTPTTVAAPSSIYEDMMRQAFERSQQGPIPPQPQGPTPYWENPETYYPQQRGPDPVAQAKAATAAAYKYIAFRGYQQALKDGKSAAEAFAMYGPMLVADGNFGTAMKALTPPPAWRYNEQTRAYEGGGRPVFNPNAAVGSEKVVPPTGGNPGYIIDAKGGIKFFPKAETEVVNPLVKDALADLRKQESKAEQTLASASADDSMKEQARTVLNWARSERNKIAKQNNIPIGVSSFTKQEATKPATLWSEYRKGDPVDKEAQGGLKIGEVRKGYRYTGGKPSLAENWEKVL